MEARRGRRCIASVLFGAMAVAIFFIGALLLPGAAGARDTPKAERELRNAIDKTLSAPELRSERNALKGQVLVEEFIAPDRFHAEIPPLGLGGDAHGTTVIQIELQVYLQDVFATPPLDELFIACSASRPANPEVFGYLLIARKANDVVEAKSGAGDTLRFHLPDDLGVTPRSALKELRGARASVVLKEGRVQEFRIRFKDAESRPGGVTWRLTYSGVGAIDAPPPDQIARSSPGPGCSGS